jgi:hypothetical protein
VNSVEGWEQALARIPGGEGRACFPEDEIHAAPITEVSPPVSKELTLTSLGPVPVTRFPVDVEYASVVAA